METMLAPCGIDCGICSGYLREKNKCLGCLVINEDNLKHILTCRKKQCVETRGLNYCYECNKFPCQDIKKLDKRYATQYGESPIQNGLFVKTNGLEAFKTIQLEKWICKSCHEGLNVHRKYCPTCNEINPNYLK